MIAKEHGHPRQWPGVWSSMSVLLMTVLVARVPNSTRLERRVFVVLV